MEELALKEIKPGMIVYYMYNDTDSFSVTSKKGQIVTVQPKGCKSDMEIHFSLLRKK